MNWTKRMLNGTGGARAYWF